MTDETETFTLAEALAAQREMRAALGLAEERFPLPAFIGMVSDEIEQLRVNGKSDAEIAALISEATGRAVGAEDVAQYYATERERHPR